MQFRNEIDRATSGLEAEAVRFGEQFRRLRRQHAGKQISLVAEGLRCTDVAISHWEGGRRLPTSTMLSNAIEILVRLGATESEVNDLRIAWSRERVGCGVRSTSLSRGSIVPKIAATISRRVAGS